MVKLIQKYKSIIFMVGGFLLGASLSGGLLLYSGRELVNALVYLAFVVVIPAILSVGTFLLFLFKKDYTKLEALRLSMLGGVFFSIGALGSLLITITTQDIAFGWSTTLNIRAATLKSILDIFGFWGSICSSCTLDENLIKLSRYVRLGASVSKEQIQHAITLGQWWKFLAMAILVYGIALRGLLYLLTFAFKKDKIEISSNIQKENFTPTKESAKVVSSKIESYKIVPYHLEGLDIDLKGSLNSDNIAVAVKSWEPPILDFFDYLEELQEEYKNSKISIYLVGLNGKASKEDIEIWSRKVKELNLDYEVIV